MSVWQRLTRLIGNLITACIDELPAPAGVLRLGRTNMISPKTAIIQLRLYSGLVLLAYVIGHLANHALGLISVAEMNRWLWLSIAPWQTLAGTVLLVGAALVHVVLALWTVFSLNNLRLPRWQWAQLVTGFFMPILLIEHVTANRLATEVFGPGNDYNDVLLALWVFYPSKAATQAFLTVVVWVHACIGLGYWLRAMPWFRPVAPWSLGVAVALPILSLAGFVAAGMEIRESAKDPVFVEKVLPPPAIRDQLPSFISSTTSTGLLIYGGLLLGTLVARQGRLSWNRRRTARSISFNRGRLSLALRRPNATLLDVLRDNDVPHAAVCGGKGRCSTCRVRITEGLETLPPPDHAERRVLERIEAPSDVRLACQIRPTTHLHVTPLLPATASIHDVLRKVTFAEGDEREIAVLFADLRGFTALSSDKLPFDVVYLLNRYFAAMGHAIEASGGRVDKFVGDGIMALFGIEDGPAAGAREALVAAGRMVAELDTLNEAMAAELTRPLRMGIGIDVGPAIVGEMGYGRAKSFTAIGDVVNTASRLEVLTKKHSCELIVSKEIIGLSGIDSSLFTEIHETVRGKESDGDLALYKLSEARTLVSQQA